VNLRAAGLTMSATCGSCGSLIDTANPQLQIIEEAHVAQAPFPNVIPIGQRGTLRGVEWEAIGVCLRADRWAKWSEYLLFNPWHGFTWLVTFNGHWSFVDRLTGIGNLNTHAVEYDGREYQLFARGAAAVSGVLGEFYWKVHRGEQAMLSDFIAPPHILSKEFYPDLHEFTWSHGTYVPHTEVAAAFGLTNLVSPWGIYLNQPNPYAAKWESVKWPWFLATLAVLLLQLVFFAMSNQRAITAFNFVFDRAAAPAAPAVPPPQPLEATSPGEPPANVLVSPHFTLDGDTSRVEIEGHAGVDNNWLGADIDLVNAKTGEHYPAELEIEYYHGYDDGPWSEGDTTGSVSIPAVPPGEYYLAVEPAADAAITKMPFQLKLTRGGLYWSNFVLVLLAVNFYPLYLLLRRRSFERSRWADSDFNPYASSEDDDS
jgi:hypothetical protein